VRGPAKAAHGRGALRISLAAAVDHSKDTFGEARQIVRAIWRTFE
jgi:hypothetical protein